MEKQIEDWKTSQSMHILRVKERKKETANESKIAHLNTKTKRQEPNEKKKQHSQITNNDEEKKISEIVLI